VSIYLVTVLLAGCILALGAAALIGHALWARVLTIAATVIAGAVLILTVLAP
jgi:hypothetical protein